MHHFYCHWCLIFLALFVTLNNVKGESTFETYETNCSSLRMGQYICPPPEIDPLTQQLKGCTKNNSARGNDDHY